VVERSDTTGRPTRRPPHPGGMPVLNGLAGTSRRSTPWELVGLRLASLRDATSWRSGLPVVALRWPPA